jgi:hypothetical protein
MDVLSCNATAAVEFTADEMLGGEGFLEFAFQSIYHNSLWFDEATDIYKAAMMHLFKRVV